ncbi:hypothetical protein ACSYAF_05445 [Edwardsiella tarda]|uniref:hypothetical protein n=1 Tax=Edwardsiella tarda TaxID=636 RepID=UPI003A6BA270
MLERPEQLAACAAGGLATLKAAVIACNVKKVADRLRMAFMGMIDSKVKYLDDKIGQEVAF